jgi:hypothetical protein
MPINLPRTKPQKPATNIQLNQVSPAAHGSLLPAAIARCCGITTAGGALCPRRIVNCGRIAHTTSRTHSALLCRIAYRSISWRCQQLPNMPWLLLDLLNSRRSMSTEPALSAAQQQARSVLRLAFTPNPTVSGLSLRFKPGKTGICCRSSGWVRSCCISRVLCDTAVGQKDTQQQQQQQRRQWAVESCCCHTC